MTYTLTQLIERLGGTLQGADLNISGVAALSRAAKTHIAYLANAKYLPELEHSQVGALVVSAALSALNTECSLIIADNPALYFSRVVSLFHPDPVAHAGRHPSAHIEASAQVTASAEIGPGVVIGHNAVIGERVQLAAGVVVGTGAVIGDDTRVLARAVIEHGCHIGARCILHAGCVVGSDGFGNHFVHDHWERIPQIGRVLVGNDVEIGANTTIDRGTLEDTVIEDGVRLDNLIHIAHNCHIGRHSALAACVGIAGSTHLGAYCMVGGAAMISGHLNIADKVHISGGTLVAKSLRKPGQYTAVYPLAQHRDWLTSAARVRQLDKLFARVEKLELNTCAPCNGDPS